MAVTSRRSFLATGLSSGAIFSGTGCQGDSKKTSPQTTIAPVPIVFRELGSTGWKVSEIGFGAMNMRDSEMVQAGIDAGINYIDTANSYMNGRNEEVVGKVMTTKRDKVFLTTKLGSWEQASRFPKMIEESLKRLKTDHVDLVLLHAINSPELARNRQFRDQLAAIRDKGQTRFIGVSTHENQTAVLDSVVEDRFWDAVLVGYNYFSPPELTEAIKRTRAAGIAIIGMKNLLNPSTDPWKPLDDIRTEMHKTSMTKEQALIRWVLDNPSVDTTIPGMTSFEHLRDDLAVMNMQLTADDRRMLHNYALVVKNNYCCGVSGCTGCRDACPCGVAVHDINRCLRYAVGYGNIELAREQYHLMPKTANLDICSQCDECTVTCINGHKLNNTITQARRLFT
jgi:uncharacterized protein